MGSSGTCNIDDSEFKSEDCDDNVAEATKLSCWKIVVAESAFRPWYAGVQQPYSQLDSTASGQAKPQESRQHLTNRHLDGFETETSSEDKLDLNLLWRLSAAATK